MICTLILKDQTYADIIDRLDGMSSRSIESHVHLRGAR